MAYYAIKVKELEEDGRCYVAEVKEDGCLGMTYDPREALIGWQDDQMQSMIDDITARRKSSGLKELNMKYVCVNPS